MFIFLTNGRLCGRFTFVESRKMVVCLPMSKCGLQTRTCETLQFYGIDTIIAYWVFSAYV